MSSTTWDSVFVITSIEPDIIVADASNSGIRRIHITKYESSSYEVTFFFPDGFQQKDIDLGIQTINLPVMAVCFGDDAMQDFVIAYLRMLDLGGHWDLMMSGISTLEKIFDRLSKHPSFKAVAST